MSPRIPTSLLPEEPDDLRDPVVALLNTPLDMAPPAGLIGPVLAVIEARRQAERARSARRWSWGIGAMAASGLAGAVMLAGKIAQPEPLVWVGELAVQGAHGFTLIKGAVLSAANWLGLLDGVVRLAESLATASQAVVFSSVRELTPVLPVATLLTMLTAIVLLRAERGRRERGMSHGTLHLFA